jgi:hypothetical protein
MYSIAGSHPAVLVRADVETDVESTGSMISSWGEGLEIDNRVLSQVNRYSEEKGEFSEGYAMKLAVEVRRLVFDATRRRLGLLSEGQCAPFVEVTYEEPGFAAQGAKPPEHKSERKFEAGFIRTELLACLSAEDTAPEAALRAYTDPEFRMRVSSRVERIWSEGEESCIETKGVRPFLSSTLVCNRIDELLLSGLAAQHSQVVANPGGKGYQDVYFKESLKTFVPIPGGMALHYINYTRTVKLGSLRKRIGRNKVIGSQEKAVRELQEVLSADAAVD